MGINLGDVEAENQRRKKKNSNFIDRDGLQLTRASSISREEYESQRDNNLRAQENNNYFKKSNGNLLQTIGGTAADITGNAVEGSLNAFEGLSDFARYRTADVLDFFGANKKAEKIREGAKENTTQGIVESWNSILAGDLSGSKSQEEIGHFKSIENNSVIGEKGDSVFQGIGNSLTNALISKGAGQGAGLALLGASAAGGAQSEAYQEGANDFQAGIYSILSGATEAGSEMLFGGLGKITEHLGFGKGALDDQLINKFTRKMTNRIVKNITELGIKSVGEGFEEVFSGFWNGIWQKITYAKEEDIFELWKNQDLMDSFISGALSSAIMQAPSGITMTTKDQDYSTGFTANEEKVVNSLVDSKVVEAQEDGRKLTNKQINEIRNKIQEQMKNGEISVEDIEKVLGGETYDQLTYSKKQISDIEREIKDLESNKNSRLLNIGKIQELRSKLGELNSTENTNKINNLQKQLSQEVAELTKNDNFIKNSYYDKEQRSQKYSYESNNKMNDLEKSIRDSAVRNLNNTIKSKKIVDTIVNLSKSNGLNYQFTSNAELRELGYDVDKKSINGLAIKSKNGNTILINADTSSAIETILGHETTHFLEGTNEYQEFQTLITEYAKNNGKYDTLRKNVEELYKDIEGADIDAEITAELTGKLFSDANFLSNLSQNKSLFDKVKDFIEELITKFTGTDEEKQLLKVKKAFNEAYKNINKNANENKVEYMYTGEKGVKNSIKADISNQEYLDKLKEAKDMYKKGLTNEEIWNKTYWFMDKNKKWTFEISDKNAKLTDKVKINSKSTIGEILKHDALYEMYPELKKVTIEFKDIKPELDPKTNKSYQLAGYYNMLTNKISVNNKLVSSKYLDNDTLRKTIIHELQHIIQIKEKFNYGYKGSDKQGWKNNLGEQEAQNTEARITMSMTERLVNKPSVMFDGNTKVQYNLSNGGSNENNNSTNYNSNNNHVNSILIEETTMDNQRTTTDGGREKGNVSRRLQEQGLENSSFSFDKNAKQYDELTKSSKVEFFTKDNGDIKVILLDSNSNLVNEITSISEKHTKKLLGDEIGDYINHNSNSIKQTIFLENDINSFNDLDYRLGHQPTATKAYASDISQNGAIPSDVYQHPEWYFNMQEKSYKESMSILNKIKGNPNAEITIYRATTGDKINPGDWVTLSKTYAEEHKVRSLNNQGQVIELKVHANEVQFAGDDINEFGYFPKKTQYSINKEDISPFKDNLTYGEEVKYQNNQFKDVSEQINKLDNKIDDLITNLSKNVLNRLEDNYENDDFNYSDTAKDNIAPIKILKQESLNPNEHSKLSFPDPAQAFLERQVEKKKLDNKDFVPKESGEKSKIRKAWDKFHEQFVNRNREIDNLSKESGNKNIRFVGDMLNNVAAELETDINNAQTDMTGKAIGKSLKEIFRPSKETGLYEAFNDYLIQKSNVERHAQGKGSKFPLAASEQLINDYESSYPEMKEWANDVYKYNHNMLQNEVDAGLISEDLAKFLSNDIYPSYVPFFEIDDSSRYYDNKGEVKAVVPIKRAVGGANVDKLAHVEESMIKQTYIYKRAIRTNELYQQIVATLGGEESIGADIRTDPTQLNDSLYIDEDGNRYLTAYFEGEQKSVKITESLYDELSKENEKRIRDLEETYSIVTKPLQKLSNIRRNILTSWNPSFILKNPIKDIQDAIINSKHTSSMLKNFTGYVDGNGYHAPAIIELAKGSTDTVKQFLSLYGSGNSMGNYQFENGTIEKQKNKGFIKGISALNELVELAPRYAEYKASIEAGQSVYESMYNAREVTTNFGRGGYVTKALNRNGFTFLNASVQGFDKFIRNFSEQNGAKQIVGTLAKVASFGIIPAIFNELVFGFGDDKDEEYEALPDYVKDNYYIIKIADGEFVRIPKGRMFSVIGSAARRTIELTEGEKDAFKGYLDNAYSQIGVGNPEENNIFAPFMQAFGSKNGDAWYGGDIVPTRLQNLPAGEQTDSSIDRLSAFIGEKLNISPYKINYVLDQYSGGIGDILLPMITEETTNGAETPLDYVISPIKDQFIVNSTDDNKYASDFFSLKDELQINSNSSKATDEDILKYKYISGISSDMSVLYKEKREVQENSSLSKSEKYEKIQKIQNQINELAKKGLDSYSSINNQGNYAQIGEYEYYKKSNGSWNKVSDLDFEETNMLGMTALEKSAYYSTKTSINGIVDEYQKNIKGITDENIKNQLSFDKKQKITTSIINSGMTDIQKASLYSNYYASEKTMNNVLNSGIDFDTYAKANIEIENIKSQYITTDNMSSKQKTMVSNSRKKAVQNYIDSLYLDIGQKLIIQKVIGGYSINSNKQYMFGYIDKLNISDEEKQNLFDSLY